MEYITGHFTVDILKLNCQVNTSILTCSNHKYHNDIIVIISHWFSNLCWIKSSAEYATTIWPIYSVIAGQTMVWTIFHLLPINLKFQWAILSKFNIAISVVNGPFSVEWVYGP